jgi:hypothetical protein
MFPFHDVTCDDVLFIDLNNKKVQIKQERKLESFFF